MVEVTKENVHYRLGMSKLISLARVASATITVPKKLHFGALLEIRLEFLSPFVVGNFFGMSQKRKKDDECKGAVQYFSSD